MTKGTRSKRIPGIVSAAVLLFLLLNFFITQWIYDGIFSRYDPETPTAFSEDWTALTFPAGENQLQGYYRSTTQNRGLVILAPGLHAGAGDYLPQLEALLGFGWDVLAFDPTGACGSSGSSAVGFPQTVYDLDAALDYAESAWHYDHIFLLGHSRGGYAACVLLQSEHPIAGVVSVSGVNSPMEAVLETPSRYVGPLAYGNYPFLWLVQVFRFGAEQTNCSAAAVLSETNVPVLLVQGSEDTTASPTGSSIYAHRQEIRSDTVSAVLLEQSRQNGHTDLLFDADGTANDALMTQIDTFYQQALSAA